MRRQKYDKNRVLGFVRVSTRHGSKYQNEALEPLCGKIFRADEGKGLEDLMTALRSGDAVLVTTLARLASRQADIMEAIDRIHKRGAFVVEQSTGRKTTDSGQITMQMTADAFGELRGDSKALPAKVARKYGKKAWQKRLAHRTSAEEAKTVWQSLKYAHMTNSDLLALPQMLGWTQESAYRRLGSRGLVMGRPRNKR